ncbi:MAG TPA: YbhB/YbcL family Raf kinase inhibitor-like protein [Candidatus Peribacteraceae bacterium]|nr:YbhB/YbcL family Raf kinase inhibitor-like protein [Candidatus Peribacteraceae bacterium]
MSDTLKNVLIGICIVVLIVLVVLAAQWNRIFPPPMSLTSSVFQQNGIIPSVYTCDGKGDHPPLTVANIPKKTASLAFFIYDPDAPRPGYTHWILYNVSPHDLVIPEGKIPDGSAEGINSSNKTDYAPLCPPSGKHHYQFTVYALDQTFKFVNPPDEKKLKNVMKFHVLARAELDATYSKQ